LKAREAIMRSPINLDDDIGQALTYAPPWGRKRVAPTATPPAASRIGATERSRNPRKVDPKFSGDRAFLKLQRQLALDPDGIPEPPAEAPSVVWPILMRLCGVLSFAAVLAWGIASCPDMKKTAEVASVDVSTAAISSGGAAPADVSVRPAPVAPQRRGLTVVHNTAISAAAAALPAATATNSPASPAAAAVTVVPLKSESAPAAPSPTAQVDQRPVLQLDADEIEMLVKRGKDFLANGDIASARLLLRRAADAGSAEGAFAFGSTFDPLVIAQLGAIGAATDAAQARRWYQRAAELGSRAASQRLAGLDASH
jgi:hypothetical protein